MRLEGLIYPDVYCLALMLSDKFDFLLEDEKVPRGKYDLILAELQSSETSTALPRIAGRAGDPPVAVIPGPPAILSRDLTDAKLRSVKRILSGARDTCGHILPSSRRSATASIGRERATVIPWPYDLAATQKLGRRSAPRTRRRARSWCRFP